MKYLIYGMLLGLFFGVGYNIAPKTVNTFSSTESSIDTTQTVTDGEIRQIITTRIYGVGYRIIEGRAMIYDIRYNAKFWTDNVYYKTLTPIDSIVQVRCYKEKECGE